MCVDCLVVAMNLPHNEFPCKNIIQKPVIEKNREQPPTAAGRSHGHSTNQHETKRELAKLVTVK